jgi:hypothetical protein
VTGKDCLSIFHLQFDQITRKNWIWSSNSLEKSFWKKMAICCRVGIEFIWDGDKLFGLAKCKLTKRESSALRRVLNRPNLSHLKPCFDTLSRTWQESFVGPLRQAIRSNAVGGFNGSSIHIVVELSNGNLSHVESSFRLK